MGKKTPYQGSAPENGSGNRPEFPTKKPDNLPQLKYDGLYRKYCRILQSTAFRQGKNTKKKEAKRNKQLNAIIEMVTMSNNDSLALRQENDMTDDKGNLSRGIDIWSGEALCVVQACKGLLAPIGIRLGLNFVS